MVSYLNVNLEDQFCVSLMISLDCRPRLLEYFFAEPLPKTKRGFFFFLLLVPV